jgi:uncharacterized ParB-like nuclease family protein
MMAINFTAPPKEAAPKPEVRDLDLEISAIKLDQSAQSRENLNTDKTAEYAAAMKSGDQFPPLVVFHDGETYWLADGFHRHYAAQQAGRKHIRCYVREGGLRDAILYSVGANAKHGVSRSDADKERAVLRLLNDDEWSTWTDRDIAKRCHVSHPFVAKVRKAHAAVTGNGSSERTFKTKHGTVATMKTAGINASRKTNAPRPSINDEPSPEVGPKAEASHRQDTGVGTLAGREGRSEGEAASADLPTPARNIFDEMVALWTEATAEDREAFIAYLRVLGFTITESNPATGTGGGHVDRSAKRASSAVKVGATNSPERADFQAKANDEARAVGQDDARAEEQSKAPSGAELVSRGVGDRAPTATTENGRDSVERHATNSNSSAAPSGQTDKAGAAVAPPASAPAAPFKPLDVHSPEFILQIRPFCKDTANCRGYGRECSCKRSSREGEAA